MNITFAPRGILQIDDARIVYRNFSGKAGEYNREGDRNFALIIDNEELADRLFSDGWNVKKKPPLEEGDIPFMTLAVKVKFNDRGPTVYLQSGHSMNKLDEDDVHRLDNIEIESVDLDIRPYDWDINGKSGRTAYLDKICVVQRIDRFAERYEKDEEN